MVFLDMYISYELFLHLLLGLDKKKKNYQKMCPMRDL